MRRGFALGAVVGLVLAAATLVVVLSQSDRRLASSNSYVVASGQAVTLPPLRTRCAPVPYIAEGASSVRVFAGTHERSGSPLRITVSRAGRPVTGGRIPGGYGTEPLSAPIRPVPRDLDGATVCVRNLGPNLVEFAGNNTPYNPEGSPTIDREDIRLDFFRPGQESWWELAGTMATRFSRVKPEWMGPWTMWAALAAIGLLWAGALAVMRRSLT